MHVEKTLGRGWDGSKPDLKFNLTHEAFLGKLNPSKWFWKKKEIITNSLTNSAKID